MTKFGMHIQWFCYGLYLVLTSCASIVAPTGGPKDETPPRLLYSEPKQGTLNFNSDEIVFAFDEEVICDKLNEEWIISPPLEKKAGFKVRKNKVTILLKETLKTNTTYRMVLGNAIKDITERNPARNLTLAFSTGPIIDTGMVCGKVIDIKSNLPKDGMIVCLLDTSKKDTIPLYYHRKPDFVGRTQKDGVFELKNLRSGLFRLYAIDDRNQNYTIQPNTEIFAFSDTLIRVEGDSLNILLSAYKEDHDPPYVDKSTRTSNGQVHITYNEGLKTFHLATYQDTSFQIIHQITEKAKKITLYPQNHSDTLHYIMSSADSCGNGSRDTLHFNPVEEYKPDSLLFLNFTPSSGGSIMSIKSFSILFSKPIQKNLDPFLEILVDSSKKFSLKKDVDFSWNKYRTEIRFIKDIYFEKHLSMLFKDSTFWGVDSSFNAPTKLILNIGNEASYGSISGNVRSQHPFYILQVLNERNEVVWSDSNPKTFNVKHLKPGNYRIRAHLDTNENGFWDSGDIFSNKPPEKYIYVEEIYTVKSNWEIEKVEIDLGL